MLPTYYQPWLHVGKLPHSLVLYGSADGADELLPNSLLNPTASSRQWTRLVPRSSLFVNATVLLNEGPVSLALVFPRLTRVDANLVPMVQGHASGRDKMECLEMRISHRTWGLPAR